MTGTVARGRGSPLHRYDKQCRVCGLWFLSGGIRCHEQSHSPFWCVCDRPDPEWVYVANQCRTCQRLIPTGTEPFMVGAR